MLLGRWLAQAIPLGSGKLQETFCRSAGTSSHVQASQYGNPNRDVAGSISALLACSAAGVEFHCHPSAHLLRRC